MVELVVLVVIGTTVWVAFDAAGRDWSTSRKWVMARGALGWAVGCLLLWIVFFPAYLAQRSRAPLKPRDEP